MSHFGLMVKGRREQMQIYSVNFTGHYPVGACAIVVAPNKQRAKELLSEELSKQGLSLDESDEWTLIGQFNESVHIPLNGDY